MDKNEIHEVEILPGAFILMRKKVLDEIGLMDESFFMYAEDMDWCKRFWNKGWKVVFFPDALALHHHGASSSRQPLRFHLEQQLSSMKYWRKHHGVTGMICISTIKFFDHSIRLFGQLALYLVWKSRRNELACKIECNARTLLFLVGFSRK